MDIIQIVGLGIIATVFIVLLKSLRPEIAMLISIITGVAIFIVVAGKLSSIVEILNNIAGKAGVDTAYLSTLLKIIGIAYIVEFGAEICKDAGESAIASKIELAGKVAIIFLAVPIITALLDLIIKVMP
ncbi:stage III sporulation protein AD [Pseudobacteroides cellulosolvens]|uniref:Stage III sporulation protein AD n=1 Tax=Pseudobacteroides cellulosolvens ATCC 35603 = DSM 2933 TaxID=398512 RepID=A0A0L6JLR6_9FIRM|nr:stage III sporulation protein AD [Pseudobacteroides cellulosolvens]KNY26694.1 stage III sporulation protein AD [Pseudobacteroides cellulosolvens ATCC 35603 = DSM 2933]